MRLLKFTGTFLLVTFLLLMLVIGLNWNSFQVFLNNRSAFLEGIDLTANITSLRGFSEFVAENGEYASLSSVAPGNSERSIYLMEDTPRAMGAVANFFILAGYAYEFDQNLKHPSDKTSLDTIQTYQLGNLGQSVSDDTFRAAEERGIINNNEITLDNLLGLLAEYNETSIADYLWWHLEEETWEWMMKELDLSSSSLPLPYSGLYLSMSPVTNPQNMEDKIQSYKEMDAGEWWRYVKQLSGDYLHSEDIRKKTDAYIDQNRLGITFTDERDALALYPEITAVKMTSLLKDLATDQLVSHTVSSHIKRWMSWPMDQKRGYITDDFEQYGAIYDNRMGLLSGINLGTSAYTGETKVQAFFMDQLPIGFWFHASSGHIHQDFMQRLIFDPAMHQQMLLSINRSNYTITEKSNE